MRIELEFTGPCFWEKWEDRLEQDCREGRVWDYTGPVPVNTGFGCPNCHGTGQVLSPLGAEIVQLVRTWGPLLAAQEAEVA